MKEILVTRNFDKTEVIGRLVLRDDIEIPYNSVFALAGAILDYDGDGNIENLDVREISLIPDENYITYLQQKDDKCHCHNSVHMGEHIQTEPVSNLAKDVCPVQSCKHCKKI